MRGFNLKVPGSKTVVRSSDSAPSYIVRRVDQDIFQFEPEDKIESTINDWTITFNFNELDVKVMGRNQYTYPIAMTFKKAWILPTDIPIDGWVEFKEIIPILFEDVYDEAIKEIRYERHKELWELLEKLYSRVN